MRIDLGILAGLVLMTGCAKSQPQQSSSTPYQVNRVPPAQPQAPQPQAPQPQAAQPQAAQPQPIQLSAPSSPAPAPAAAPAPPPAMHAPTPIAIAPSLEQERQAQAQRAAADLSKQTGVAVDKTDGIGPAWWPKGSVGGSGYGRGRATTLDLAFQQGSHQAAGNDHSIPISRVAYSRLTTGDYLVWVEMRRGGAPPPAPAPAPAPVPAPAPAPAPAAAPTPSPYPAWFSTTAKVDNGRVVIGGTADASTVEEASRSAAESGKNALIAAISTPLSDLRIEATYVEKHGNGYRSFVLLSSVGTIKK